MKKALILVLFSILVFSNTSVLGDIRYKVIDLGSFGGGLSKANGINDLGQVVGWSRLSNGLDHGFLWENGVMKDLGTLTDNRSYAESINNRGQIVGESWLSSSETHAFLYENEVMKDLGALGVNSSHATSINNKGQIAGFYDVSSYYHGFLLDGGNLTDLGSLGNNKSFAYAINEQSQIVGGYQVTGSRALGGFIWENGVMRDLGNLGKINASYATDINNQGLVIGSSSTVSDGMHGFIWDGQMHDIGDFEPFAINDAGAIVGRGGGAVLWEDNQILQLNFMIDENLGWFLDYATDINENGQIVGYGEINGETHGFLLNPIPAPGALILGSMGIGLIGVLRKRKML